MKQDRLSVEIPKADRNRLSLYKSASSVNQRFLSYLLDFVETRFGLLPRESPTLQICFRPQFAAFVAANKTQGGLRISLFGDHFVTGKVLRGKFPNWRAYAVYHTDDLFAARCLIEEAYQHRVEADAKGRWTFKEEIENLKEYLLG
jgi:hypothetical protein